ncbi:MAG TPA: hypothetical protein VF284_06740 [Rhodanobacteraceae bacterium]
MNDNGLLISPVLGSFNPAEYKFPYLDPVLNPSFDVLGFSAGMSLLLQQFNYFTPTSIDGTLFYQLQGSNVIESQDFNLGGSLALPVDLNQTGTYDFWFGNWSLNNQFSWNVDLYLGATESTPVGCGTLHLYSCNWSQTLANPTIYSSGSFALDFGANALSPFQITVGNVVAAPEPRFLGLGMLGAGALLLCLLDVRRRRRTFGLKRLNASSH